jgi:hypothetical protein
VDELCADGPVVLCADGAHNLDRATLTLLRRLVWASRDLRWRSPCPHHNQNRIGPRITMAL